MNASEFHPDQFQSHSMKAPMIGLPKVNTEDLAVKAESLDVIEVNGEQYAKLPEGWPAAEDKDLAEAHAEAVAADEPESEMPEWERKLYSWTAAEVKELIEAWIDLGYKHREVVDELTALRKGMKTMQRKHRKSNQQQRRLERRLAQARAGRERQRDEAEMYRNIAAINTEAALKQSLAELGFGETVAL